MHMHIRTSALKMEIAQSINIADSQIAEVYFQISEVPGKYKTEVNEQNRR